MDKKLWYACMHDREYQDCGTGSFDLEEAKEIVRNFKLSGLTNAYIAVIDGDYDEDGNATTDTLCVDEIEVEYPYDKDIYHLVKAEHNSMFSYYVQRCGDYKCFVVDWDLSKDEEKELIKSFEKAVNDETMKDFIDSSYGARERFEWEDEENVKGECRNEILA